MRQNLEEKHVLIINLYMQFEGGNMCWKTKSETGWGEQFICVCTENFENQVLEAKGGTYGWLLSCNLTSISRWAKTI